MRAKSEARRKSPRLVPVQAESILGAPPLEMTSSICTVRKSILKRVSPEVFGTVECIWAPEKMRNASDRKNNANLWIKLHRFLRHGLYARVFADVLRGVEPANAIPFRIVIDSGTVANGLTPIVGMESHDVFRNDVEHRNPPVELALWGRIPRVAVRMEGIGNTGA